MKLYTLRSVQKLPVSPEKAWSFLLDPKNLKTLTPDFMGLEFRSGDNGPMFPVTFLLSEHSSWITGQVLGIDGGLSTKNSN